MLVNYKQHSISILMHASVNSYPFTALTLGPRLYVSGYILKTENFSPLLKKKYASTRSVFESFSPVHTKTLERWKYDNVSYRACANEYRESRLILKFSVYSSGTTIWSTKVNPPCTRSCLTQNLRGVAGLLFGRFTAFVLDNDRESILITFNRFLA